MALFSSKPTFKKIPSLSPEQTNLQNQLISLLSALGKPGGLFQQGQSYLQNLLSESPETMQKFEAPYLSQFQKEIIPALAERFAGSGAQSSSAFQQALGQAGADLQERLASLRGGMQLQALPQALGLMGQYLPTALQSRFTTAIRPGSPSVLSEFLSPLLAGAGGGIGQIGGSAATRALFPGLFQTSGGIQASNSGAML
jgi:hypothetical protein